MAAYEDETVTGKLAAVGDTVSIDPDGGQSSCGLLLAGTFSAGSTVVFETTLDNVTWFGLPLTPIGGGTAVTSTVGGSAQQFVGNCAAQNRVRVRITALAGGDSITVLLRVSTASSASGSGGGGGGGSVTVSDGTNTVFTAAHPAVVQQGNLASATDSVTAIPPASVAIQAALATTANTYAAGNAIGSAALTLANAARTTGGTAVIESIVVDDTSHQNAAMDILLFNAAPTTTPTDKTAYSLSASDKAAIIGKVKVPASAYDTYGTSSVAVVSGLGIVIAAAAGQTSIFAVAVCQGAPVYTANCVEITLGLLRD